MSLRRHIHRSVAPVAVECVIAIVGTLQSPPRGLATVNWQVGLAMRRGNAGPGNIGNDFDRLGVSLWRDLYSMDGRNRVRNIKLDNLNKWRNAIAHDDFRNAQVFPNGSRTALQLAKVRDWRRTCNHVASNMDELMRNSLAQLLGTSPW